MSIIQIFFLIGGCIAGALSIFQILLFFGLPLGRMAWGGEHAKLPKKLRISSFISSLLLIYALFLLLEKGGFINIPLNNTINYVSLWVFVIIFGLSTLGNISSKSKSEKIVMTPIAFYLFLIFLFTIIG